ncbi:hypothetical protein [Baaleninema sp.]
MRGRSAVGAKQFDLTGRSIERYSRHGDVSPKNRDRGADASMS